MNEPPGPQFELQRVHIAYLAGRDGTLRPAFLIDGRNYADAEAMQHDLDEAWTALTDRRIAAEFETRPTTSTEPLPALPSWLEYRDEL